jgi:hypothetical protein
MGMETTETTDASERHGQPGKDVRNERHGQPGRP